MTSNGNPAKGYYSILQFVPDMEREEGVNVGVVLFCPDKGFLKAKTASSADRMRRLVQRAQRETLSIDRLNALKSSFEERIETEFQSIQTAEDFRQFVNSRANLLLLTDPRPIKVFDPDKELSDLFSRLVSRRQQTERERQQLSAKKEMVARFDVLLRASSALPNVQRNVEIESRLVAGRRYKFPYCFRNGLPNVIKPLSFEASTESSFNQACKLVVEGEDLMDRPDPIKLRVLGAFKPEATESLNEVRAVLSKFDVDLHTSNELEQLVEEIEQTAH